MSMRYGVTHIIDGRPGRGLEFIQGTARLAEELGFATFWAPDHVVFFDEYESRYPHSESGKFGFLPDQGLFEPLMVLQAAAQVTSTLRLGTSVEILTQRNPVIRAREIATLDVLSDGRFEYGIGVGWSREELEACGVSWPRRGVRADEYIEAMKALWRDRRSTYQGEFVSFEDVICFPKPIQQPAPPILVGGISRAAARRAARHGDGWYGWKLTVEELDGCLAMIDEELEAAGRTRDGFRLYLGMPHHGDPRDLVDYLGEVESRGIEQFTFGLGLSSTRYQEQMEAYASALGLDGPAEAA